MNQKQAVAILGSTGSIGTQTLSVLNALGPNYFPIVLSARSKVYDLIEQCLKYKPKMAVIELEEHYVTLKNALGHTDIELRCGEEGLIEAASLPESQTVITALVGYSGLKPTLAAIANKKNIALANKETLVVAGEWVMRNAKEKNVNILPVDSEHSAIFQCLAGENNNPIEKLILTASGGPFRGKSRKELETVTLQQALKHPNWSMGSKITIDSATLMNKGLEVIEAHWLFDVDASKIDVVVHPQSIIHSMVEFEDGSIKAQLGLPDMRLPIQYALTYPKRERSLFPKFHFTQYPQLTFEQPDRQTFRNLDLAFYALKTGGNTACILNAANEIAVTAFLEEKISFLTISEIIEKCLEKISFIQHPQLEEYFNTDKETRIFAKELI